MSTLAAHREEPISLPRAPRRALRKLLGAALLLAASSWPAPATSQAVDPNLWVTNGEVNAVVCAGEDVYIGGQFTRVGPATGAGVPLDASSAVLPANFPKVTGLDVYAVVPDGGGGWYIGGLFNAVGGLPRTNLAHIKSDMSVDTWAPNPDGPVYCLAMGSSVLYVGGNFTTISGSSRYNIAAIDVTTGAATAWNPVADARVVALAVSGSKVYAGGEFASIGGQSRLRIAAIDVTTGAATAWSPNANAPVSTIVPSASGIFVGGSFSIIGGQSRSAIAQLDPTTGGATPWNPSCIGGVNTLALSGNNLFVGGVFSFIGGAPRNSLALLDATTGEASSWNPNPNGLVNALSLSPSVIFVGGSFTTIAGLARNNAAAIDPVFGTASSWDAQLDAAVYTMAWSGSTVYAGGAFKSAGGAPRNNLAALERSTGQVSSWNPNVNNVVYALAMSGSTVYAGGAFTQVGGASRTRIAGIDANTGIATSFNPSANGIVRALAVNGPVVYVGGEFTMIATAMRNRIAALKLDGTEYSWNPNADGIVRAIAPSGSTVYIGGSFTTVSGLTRNRIAAVDSTSGVATGWNPNANGDVYALAVTDRVYAGGDFTTMGFQARGRAATIDINGAFPHSWNPDANGRVAALAVTPSVTYLGGNFTQVGGGQPRAYLAAVEHFTAALKAWDPGASQQVIALAARDSVVFAGGWFWSMGTLPQARVAAISAIPEVRLIYPYWGGNGGPITVVFKGNGFRGGASAKLVRSGFPDIPGTNVTVAAAGGESLSVTFDLTGQTAGLWNGVVTNPDGMSSSVTNENLYLIQAVAAPQLRVSIVGPDAIRAGFPAAFDLVIENPGNVDAVAVPLWVTGIPTTATVGLDFGLSSPPQSAGEPAWSGVPRTFASPAGQYLPLVIPRVPPGTLTRRITLNVPSSVPTFQLVAAVAASWAGDPVFRGCLSGAGVIANPTCVGIQLGSINSYLSTHPEIEAMSGTGVWAKIGWQCEGATTLAGAIAKSEQVLDHLAGAIEQETAAPGCGDALLARWRQVLAIQVVTSIDPNDKLSPPGLVSSLQAIPYSIRFENLANAGASAQRVTISDVLSTNLELNSFTLDAVAFGSTRLIPPPGTSQYTWDVDLGPAKGIIVRVVAGATPSSPFDRTVVWSFVSLDRTTGQPLDPASPNGFLPPNVNPPEGEGSVLFTIRPSSQAANGTQIQNAATINFDGNVLTTPQVSNQLDTQAPASNVLALGTPISDTSFPVTWQGSGQELRDYTIYVAEDAAPYQVWKQNTLSTTDTYSPRPGGHSYSFYSVARDLTGNIEPAPASPDAQTYSTTDVGRPGFSGLSLLGAQPNPARGVLRIGFSLPSREPAKLELIDIAGRRVLRREVGELGPGSHVLTLGSIPQLKSGLYFLRLIQANHALETRVVLMK